MDLNNIQTEKDLLLLKEKVKEIDSEILKDKYIKDYAVAKRRGNGEKDLKDEVHNVIYDNSNKVNTKIKAVQKTIINID